LIEFSFRPSSKATEKQSGGKFTSACPVEGSPRRLQERLSAHTTRFKTIEEYRFYFNYVRERPVSVGETEEVGRSDWHVR
jgi:hypothetical protein